jgi:hypothetical protein
MAWKLLFLKGNIMAPINSGGHLKTSERALRRLPKKKAQRKGKARLKKDAAAEDEPTRPAVGTLSRTKSLLLAALRVWELKNGIHE